MTSKPKGRGRPFRHDKKQMVSLRLEQDTIAYLATTENKTVTVETAVQQSKGYRSWKANHKEKSDD